MKVLCWYRSIGIDEKAVVVDVCFPEQIKEAFIHAVIERERDEWYKSHATRLPPERIAYLKEQVYLTRYLPQCRKELWGTGEENV